MIKNGASLGLFAFVIVMVLGSISPMTGFTGPKAFADDFEPGTIFYTTRTEEFPAGVLTVINHTGGFVEVEISRRSGLMLLQDIFYVKGSCASACTIWLSYPFLCVHPDAIFRFHDVYDPDTKQIIPGAAERFSELLPEKVAEWYLNSDAIGLPFDEAITVTAEQIYEWRPTSQCDFLPDHIK